MRLHQYREKQKQMVRRILKPQKEVTDFVKRNGFHMSQTCLWVKFLCWFGVNRKIYCTCMFTQRTYKSTQCHQSAVRVELEFMHCAECECMLPFVYSFYICKVFDGPLNYLEYFTILQQMIDHSESMDLHLSVVKEQVITLCMLL